MMKIQWHITAMYETVMHSIRHKLSTHTYLHEVASTFLLLGEASPER